MSDADILMVEENKKKRGEERGKDPEIACGVKLS